jgi:hypothetical protein
MWNVCRGSLAKNSTVSTPLDRKSKEPSRLVWAILSCYFALLNTLDPDTAIDKLHYVNLDVPS